MRGVHPPEDTRQRITFFRLRASIESGLGNSKAAAADMELAARLAPEDAQLQAAAALSRLEVQLETHADPAVTLKALRGVQLPVEKLLEVRLRTGEVLSRAHRYGEAAEDLADASRMAPNRADIHFNLALARYYNGQWDAALESAERAKTLEDSGATESLLGDIQEKRGDALAAVHSYQAAVSLEPNVEQHRLSLATELLKHQTFDAAFTSRFSWDCLTTWWIARRMQFARCWKLTGSRARTGWPRAILAKSPCKIRPLRIRVP